MSRRYFSNSASVGVISGPLNDSDTSTSVTLSSGSLSSWPSTPCTAAVNLNSADEEVVLVTSISGTSVTFTRGFDGSPTRSHTAGATLTHVSVARDFDEANSHVNALTGVHGVAAGSSVVGTSDTQTLSGKTFIKPTVADFTNANHTHAGATSAGNIPQSSVVGLAAALTALAQDDTVVHNTGVETVAGAKTFSDAVTMSGNASVGGTLDVTGNTTVGGTLTVGGQGLWDKAHIALGTFDGNSDGSGVITIAHGLSWTPTYFFFQMKDPTGQLGAGLPTWQSADATNVKMKLVQITGQVNGINVKGFWMAVR